MRTSAKKTAALLRFTKFASLPPRRSVLDPWATIFVMNGETLSCSDPRWIAWLLGAPPAELLRVTHDFIAYAPGWFGFAHKPVAPEIALS